jgi:ribosomal-protein-serine acetyltransferase
VSPFPVDRAHPPSRLVYHDGARHLELRPWAMTDVDPLTQAVNESLPELRAFMPWAHQPITREVEFALLSRFQADYHAGRDLGFGMFSESGEILGGVGLHARVPLNPAGLEVGYWCRSAHAGKGWVTLAVRMVTALVFDRFGCDRFQVSYDEANVASRRVVEKCGFPFEGIVRNLMGAVPVDARETGYRGTRRHRLHALVPEDLARLDWLAALRAHTKVYDALGGRCDASAAP